MTDPWTAVVVARVEEEQPNASHSSPGFVTPWLLCRSAVAVPGPELPRCLSLVPGNTQGPHRFAGLGQGGELC